MSAAGPGETGWGGLLQTRRTEPIDADSPD